MIKIFNIPNPDSSSVASKSTIDLTPSTNDIVSSSFSSSMKLNYMQDGLIVEVDGDVTPSEEAYAYYTPLYSEKLYYDEWQVVVDKTFRELN